MAFTCSTCGKKFRSTAALGKHYADEPGHRGGKRATGDAAFKRLKKKCQGASLAEILWIARDLLDEEIETKRKQLKNAKSLQADIQRLQKQRDQVAELVLRHSEKSPPPAKSAG